MFKALHTLIGALVVALVFASTAATANTTYLPIEAMVYYVQTASASTRTCNGSVAYDSSASGSTQLVALSSGATIYICGYTLFGGNSGAQAQLVYGTGSNCATGRTALTPPYQLTGQTPIVDGGDYVEGLQTAASNALCIVTNYTYYRAITIDHTKVGTVNNTDQSNFPVLVSGTYTQLKTVANGGHVQNANGYDIIFTSDAAGVTPLNYEVESYNASTGVVTFWVKVPTVSHTADTVIYMWYGNPAITTPQANATGVWDTNFQGVWHMQDNAANTTIVDSTGQNTATMIGGNTSSYPCGSLFASTSQSLYFGGNNAVVNNSFSYTSNYTMESWYYNNVAFDSANQLWSNAAIGASAGYNMSMLNGGQGYSVFTTSGYLRSFYNNGFSTVHVAMSCVSGTLTIYVNGAAQNSQSGCGTTPNGNFTINSFYAGQYNTGFNGNMCMAELRVSSSGRSADWIKTSYNNQNSPSTFYTVGSEQQP